MVKKVVKKEFMICSFLLVVMILSFSNLEAAVTIEKKVGLDIPIEEKVTKLAEILESPAAYHGKKVLLEGVFAGACPSLCEFTYQEGKKTIMIYVKDFKLPRMKKGQRIRVYAEVTVGKERVVLSALGLEVMK